MTTGKRAELKKRFEANMLDGDKIQDGQMLSAKDVFEYMVETLDQYTTTVAEEAKTVTRFEVINHLSDGSGREVIVWDGKPFKVEPSLQDNSRTLKVFLTDIEQLTKSKEAKT